MPNFSDALQGYENGANNAVRVGAERLSIPTPVQSFLAQLQKQKEMGLQQQQVGALESYRNALAGNAGQRVENQRQHYQDMADAATAKQELAEQKLRQALILSNRRMDIQQQIANTNQATAEGKQKVLGLQAQLQEIDLQTRDAYNESRINLNNMGGQQKLANAGKETATTPGSGVANPKDALSIYQKSQQQADAYNRMGAGIKGFVPKVPLTMEQAKDLAAQANTDSSGGAEKDALTLMEPPDAYTPSIRNSNDKLTPEQPPIAAPSPIQPVPRAVTLPGIPTQLPQVPIPQDASPLEALLKRRMPLRLPTGPLPPSGPNPVPPADPGPYPPNPDLTPNYPINAGSPVPGPVIPLGDNPGQQAAVDPLHGQMSQRAPGIYNLNGRQYLVDGSGTIQSLG